jgi:hypothetical protein
MESCCADLDQYLYSQKKESNLNMGYGNRDKPERKSGRVGFVEGRTQRAATRWENATDEREKSEVSAQIREWQSLRPRAIRTGRQTVVRPNSRYRKLAGR